MRQRGEENRLKLWVLMTANRWVVAGGVLATFCLGLLLIAAVAPNSVVIAVDDPVETLFQALVTATITGVTLVVSINSLVLSQELGPLGDQRERMEGAMRFRSDVEAELGLTVAPAKPAAFLRALVDAVDERGERLAGAAAAARDADGEPSEVAQIDDERVSEFADTLRRHASSVSDALSERQFGTFGVLSAALDFNYSWKIHEARQLRSELGEGNASPGEEDATLGNEDGSLGNGDGSIGNGDGSIGNGDASPDDEDASADVRAALDDVIEALSLFGPAREHVKTLYFQWELVDLSRAMLYSAVPALIVAAGTLLFHGALSGFSGTTLGIAHYVWIVALAASVSLTPFAVLVSFVLRIGTVAKRTLSIGPFILRTRKDDSE